MVSAEYRWKGLRPSASVSVAFAYVLSCGPVCDAGVGFCLDSIPAQLEGTGFTAPSNTLQASCEADGYQWCPLDNQTDTWNGQAYYWYSACCGGRQGATLLVDSAGYPTCASNKSAQDCTRGEWHEKVLLDLVLNDDYVFDASPSTNPLLPMRSPSGQGVAQSAAPCICAPDSPNCEDTDAAGTVCLNCRTDVPCSNDTVSLGLHIFKMHTIDLKSTHMSLAAWIRESWNDPRLSYNAQCYAGLDYFEVKAQDAALEDTRVWVPDIELYNNEEPIWAGPTPGRLAMIYPCTSNGKPSTGVCGSVFWSRPSILKTLCKFEGLEMFPLDSLRCKLELAAFSVDGRYQDIMKRSVDGGINWVGKEEGKFAGVTAGSKFQDYSVKSVSCTRHVTIYDCCPHSPYPTLIYEVRFIRARTFYVVRLVLPAVSLALISFITFWMNPEIGERLGFGITVILAMVANDVVASGMMPIAGERLLMDHVSLGCQICGWVSLLETALVLYLYHHLADNWLSAVVPAFLLEAWRRVRIPQVWMQGKSAVQDDVISLSGSGRQRHGAEWPPEEDGAYHTSSGRLISEASIGRMTTAEEVARLAHGLYVNKDAMIRKHLYRQIFYMVDKDFSGSLSVEEIEEFGSFMMGSSWNKAKARTFMRSLDVNGDGVLKLDEFAIFCEGHLDDASDTKYITKMVEGFLSVLERKRDTKVRMWRDRANQIDRVCRWTLPPGFIVFLAILFSMDEDQMKDQMQQGPVRVIVYMVCYLPLLMLLGGTFLCFLRHRRNENAHSQQAHQPGMFGDPGKKVQSRGPGSEDPPRLDVEHGPRRASTTTSDPHIDDDDVSSDSS